MDVVKILEVRKEEVKQLRLQRKLKKIQNLSLNQCNTQLKVNQIFFIKTSIKNDKLNKSMLELEQKMVSNKETIFDKEYVKVKKDTFDSMNKVI